MLYALSFPLHTSPSQPFFNLFGGFFRYCADIWWIISYWLAHRAVQSQFNQVPRRTVLEKGVFFLNRWGFNFVDIQAIMTRPKGGGMKGKKLLIALALAILVFVPISSQCDPPKSPNEGRLIDEDAVLGVLHRTLMNLAHMPNLTRIHCTWPPGCWVVVSSVYWH